MAEAAGESGTGLLNTAMVNSNGNQRSDTACAVVPPAPPRPTVPPGNPDPEIPATGGSSQTIAGIAGLLLVLGGLVLVASRRKRHPGAQPS